MSDIVPPEGQGDSALFADKHHIRQDLRTLTAALKAGWNVPEDVRRDALAIAADIMRTSPVDRDRNAAIRLLLQMHKDDIEALTLLDKITRLETGGATERIELKPVTFERRD